MVTLRPVELIYDAFGYADASVLLKMGKTYVFCSVSLQKTVPTFLHGQPTGWLTAEYSMLPTSTQQRLKREACQAQRNSRHVEISRLIGRCFRSIVDLTMIKEKTIHIDCDVLQADGGTRVAAITGANYALALAAERWIEQGILKKNILTDSIAAISAGVLNNEAVLDLTYEQDAQSDADFNFVMTKSGKIIEIQGTAEKKPISQDLFNQVHLLAREGIKQLFEICDQVALPGKDKDNNNCNPMKKLSFKYGS